MAHAHGIWLCDSYPTYLFYHAASVPLRAINQCNTIAVSRYAGKLHNFRIQMENFLLLIAWLHNKASNDIAILTLKQTTAKRVFLMQSHVDASIDIHYTWVSSITELSTDWIRTIFKQYSEGSYASVRIVYASTEAVFGSSGIQALEGHKAAIVCTWEQTFIWFQFGGMQKRGA